MYVRIKKGEVKESKFQKDDIDILNKYSIIKVWKKSVYKETVLAVSETGGEIL